MNCRRWRRTRSGCLPAGEAADAGTADETAAEPSGAPDAADIDPAEETQDGTAGDAEDRDEAAEAAEIIVVSFPVYFFGMPGPVKTITDRMIPMMHAYDGGPILHRVRPAMQGKRFLFVSTCGFHTTKGIYEPLQAQLKAIFEEHIPPLVTIPQAELMQVPQMKEIVDHRLELVKSFGKQFAKGETDDALLAQIASPLILERAYHRLVKMMRPDS